MSIGEKFATKNEVEVLRRKLQLALNGATIVQIEAEEIGVTNFTDLADVPSSYAAAGNFAVRVKSTVDELEFAELLGTSNQVTVTANAADYTLSLPQDIHAAATPTFAGMYLQSASAAPFLKLTNASDTARDPILQFAVGATPAVKYTMGVDDSDNDTWKLSVGNIFGDDHDVIIISSDGGVPGLDEFTLINTFTGVSDVWGICRDGTYIYCSRGSDKKLYKFDITDGTQLAVSSALAYAPGRMATDGTHVYVIHDGADEILKYLCADLTYVGVASWAGLNAIDGICYRAGYLYVTNQGALDIRKIRCSDMGTTWTVSFGLGSGSGEMDRPNDITTDGQFIYVQDSANNNRIVRLNMNGTWYDATAVVKPMSSTYHALWLAGDYLYVLADYAANDYYVEKRNKSNLSISETFNVLNYVTQGCQWGDYHYLVSYFNQGIYKYQYATSSASAPAKMRFRLKNAYGQYVDIATLTADVRLGVGTTIPSETIEAVGNIKAQAGQFISTMATGTAPVVVSSTTVCTNLNAGLWDGYHLPALAVGDMLYGDGTTTVAKLADVAVGSYLRSGGVTTAPLWSTLTLPNTGTAYRLPVFSATNVMTELAAVGATGQYLAGNTGGIPSWANISVFEPALGNPGTTGWVLSSTDGGVRSWIAAGGGGTFLSLTDVDEPDYTGHAGHFVVVNGDEDALIFSASSVAAHDVLSVTHGDTLASAVSRGSIIYGNSTPKWAELAVGTVGQVLTTDGTDIMWGAGGSGAPTDAQYVVLAVDGDLSAERVLTAGKGITLTDAGANGAATLAYDPTYGSHQIMREAFDGLATGDINGLGSYYQCSAWVTNNAATCTTEVAVKSGADKMLRCYAPAGAGTARVETTMSSTIGLSGGCRIRFKMRIDQDATGYSGGLVVANAAGTTVASVRFGFSTDMKIRFYDGTTNTNIQSASKNTWYQIDMFISDISLSTGVARIFIDGTYATSLATATHAADWDGIDAYCTNSAAGNLNVDIDDLYVYSTVPLFTE